MRADALVAGGGLAGPTAAIALARAGRSVTLVERESRPHHKVCGEFLSMEALGSLRQLDVNVSAMGAVPIAAVRLAGRLGVSETPLPFAAMSLTRKRLDEEMLRLAEDSGVKVVRGVAVQTLAPCSEGWRATLSDGSFLDARAAFVATGKHDVHGRARPAGSQSDLIGFKMYWRLSREQSSELDGHVELNLYRGGYAGLQPVEDGIANLCCLIQRDGFRRVGGRWKDLLQAMQCDCPHLARRLAGAQPLLIKPLAISSIPYGFVRERSDGTWSVGDQAAVIPSFTGDGMSIALHSGRLAAEMYLKGESAEAYQQQLGRELSSQVSLAVRLSRGMVREPQRTLMEAAVRLWPGVLQHVGARTRLSCELPVEAKIPVAKDDLSVGTY